MGKDKERKKDRKHANSFTTNSNTENNTENNKKNENKTRKISTYFEKNIHSTWSKILKVLMWQKKY